MKRSQPPLSPEVRSLLDHERDLPPLPATVRARAIARARAALVAGVAIDRSAAPARRPRWVAAAAAICIMGAAVGAAAYQIRAYISPAPRPSDRPAAPAATAAPRAPSVPAVPMEPIAEAPPAPAPAPEKPVLSRADAARAELRLLRHARAAVAREDYAAAMASITEHARLFKTGRLAEEREALRVKALVGLGRTEEARRAAAAFKARFPRSVLLPAVSRMPSAEP